MSTITPQPSQRAIEASQRDTVWNLMMENKNRRRYHPQDCPDGFINLSGAINGLMTDWTEDFLRSLPPLSIPKALSYAPLHGSPGLLAAAADFFNQFFHPASTISESNILAANGVTSLLDITAWAMCEPGDAVLTLTPNFFLLDFDLALRAGVLAVPVSTEHIDDPFSSSDQLLTALDSALRDAAENRSLRCRALFICNPSNPEGRCYSRQTLEALALWCGRRGLHLVSDEIYALSNFAHVKPDDNGGADDSLSAEPSESSFTSLLSIASGPLAQNLHCLYSLSKDFGMGGLRMGFWVTANISLLEAATTATWFTWVTAFSDHLASSLLGQPGLVHEYLTQYRRRLGAAYLRTTRALRKHQIPFAASEAGLFVFVDLHDWVRYFGNDNPSSPERQLCQWLIVHGVFLNPGQFSGSLRPGRFRLVFTGDIDAVEVAAQRIRTALDELEQRQTPVQDAEMGLIAR